MQAKDIAREFFEKLDCEADGYILAEGYMKLAAEFEKREAVVTAAREFRKPAPNGWEDVMRITKGLEDALDALEGEG